MVSHIYSCVFMFVCVFVYIVDVWFSIVDYFIHFYYG